MEQFIACEFLNTLWRSHFLSLAAEGANVSSVEALNLGGMKSSERFSAFWLFPALGLTVQIIVPEIYFYTVCHPTIWILSAQMSLAYVAEQVMMSSLVLVWSQTFSPAEEPSLVGHFELKLSNGQRQPVQAAPP